jgi:hypothetical protein
MADDFLVFLVAGLIIIAVLIAGFAMYPFNWGAGEKKCCEPSQDILDFQGALFVGPKDIDTYRPYELGHFTADFESGLNIYTLGNKVIKNGVLFGDTDFRYHIESLHIEEVQIKFVVRDTNNYGPLVVKVNGIVLEERAFEKGEYTINAPVNILSDDMLVEIYATSSGLRLWAPTYYDLGDVRLLVKGFSQNSLAYSFTTIEEYNTFSEGRIELQLDENVGEIVITMNDREIYSGPVTNLQTFKFSKSYLNYGQNYMAIYAKENSRFSGTAKMLIFYKTIYDTRLDVPFSLNQTEFDKLKTGRITFDILSVTRGGGLSVKIACDNRVTYNAYADLAEGNYEFTFDKSNVRLGTNYLIIGSVDKGVFAIKNVAVKI